MHDDNHFTSLLGYRVSLLQTVWAIPEQWPLRDVEGPWIPNLMGEHSANWMKYTLIARFMGSIWGPMNLAVWVDYWWITAYLATVFEYITYTRFSISWWRHQMEKISILPPSVRESTGDQWLPLRKARDVELLCFFYLCLNKWFGKQSRSWWLKTTWCSQ